ncbi:MAG: hypothetical protein QM718_09935 [Steroidobacteraceae bacterium]
MSTSAVQSAKLTVMAFTGLSKDALHVYVGLSVFLLTALFVKGSLRSPLPWLLAALVACAGEVADMIDDIHVFGHWRWRASLHDVLNTLAWPTVLFLLARFTRLFARTGR